MIEKNWANLRPSPLFLLTRNAAKQALVAPEILQYYDLQECLLYQLV